MIALAMVLHLRAACNWTMGWAILAQPALGLAIAIACRTFFTRSLQGTPPKGILLPFILLGILCPLLLDLLERRLGYGDSGEVVFLQVFANLALTLAFVADQKPSQNLSTLFAATCVFIVMAISADWTTGILAMMFGGLVLGRAMTGYWQSLEEKFADDCESVVSAQWYRCADDGSQPAAGRRANCHRRLDVQSGVAGLVLVIGR